MPSFSLKSIFVANEAWRWGWQLLSYVVLLILSVGIIVGGLAWLLVQVNVMPSPGQRIQGWLPALGYVLIQLVLYVVVLGATYQAQRWLRHSTLGALGLRLQGNWDNDLRTGLGLGVLMIGISVGLSGLMGWYHPLGFSWRFRPLSELMPALLVSFFANLQPGLLEEVVFRGYLLQSISDRWGIRAAVLSSSILFGLMHLGSLGDDFPWWATVVSTTLAGLLLAQAFFIHRSLWLPIGIHFAWDWCIGLFGAVGKPMDEALLLASNVTGPPLLQGPRSAGAGLFDLIGMAVVALILWKIAQQHKEMKPTA